MSDVELVDDAWYSPDVDRPYACVQPSDLDLMHLLHRTFAGEPLNHQSGLSTVALEPLPKLPWLGASSRSIFNAAARSVIDDAAWPGEIRWLPLVIETPIGPVDEYQVLAPPLEGNDFLSDALTSRDPRGAPIRWVLDPDKLGERSLIVLPGMAAGIVMRGHVLKQLIDLGAKGLDILPARIAPSSAH